MPRRLVLGLLVAVVLALGLAAGAGAGSSTSVPVSWVFVGDGATNVPPNANTLACPFVPDGVWVQGTGTLTFFDPTGHAGNLQSEAHGTATDSAGGSYSWNYHQSIQPFGDGSTVRIVDQFELSGSGAAGGIRSHFIAIATETTFEPLLLKGDPFHCDPI